MKPSDWNGVFPAITTPFSEDLSVDPGRLAGHVEWMEAAGCHGIVPLGSLGEGATLSFEEKIAVVRTCRKASGLPLVPGISGLSTAEACALARAAEKEGCDGLMLLPPYAYRGDWRETDFHFMALLAATKLPCILYNNPIAYGTDVRPPEIAALAVRENLQAVKESSGDVRRVTEISSLLGDRISIFIGMDDLVGEAVTAGARGWIAGLVNALPEESVRLFDLAGGADRDAFRRLYDWFLPLLRLDTVPKFVQLIKLAQAEVGRGAEWVRPPRLPLAGPERDAAVLLIRRILAARPVIA